MELAIALAQVNPTVGDVTGNLALVRRARDEAARRGADLVIFPELVLVGYPPEDLVLRPAFVEAAAAALRELELESAAGGPGLIVTLPWRDSGDADRGPEGPPLRGADRGPAAFAKATAPKEGPALRGVDRGPAASAKATAPKEGPAPRGANRGPQGPPLQDGTLRHAQGLRNAVALVADGQTQIRFKRELPNYGVFDEKRVFSRGPLPDPVTFRGIRIGIPICEDIWLPDVAAHLAGAGAELLLVPNGSPFEVEKFQLRIDLARQRALETGLPLVYVNQVGGQDELVFDGGSFVVNGDGSLAAVMPLWRESVTVTRWTTGGSGTAAGRTAESGKRTYRCEDATAEFAPEPRLSAVYNAMMLGLRDYVEKNRFPGIVLGLSGGIDSALTAAVAVDALGPARVRGVRLPSQFTSDASMVDAEETARLLGIRLDTLAIEPMVTAAEATLAPVFTGRPRDVAEENVQARIRGVLLMALSNKFGELLITTGNKSEMSVGYATLYGDMNGGYSVLKDIYKTEVYALSHWRNEHRPTGALGPEGRAIPESSITKAPTAELRPNQTDQDSLPPYEELDAILTALVEKEQSVREIVAQGFARETVVRIQRMLYLAEYKRRQAPPGVKITRRSFGRDRRYPLTNAFREP